MTTLDQLERRAGIDAVNAARARYKTSIHPYQTAYRDAMHKCTSDLACAEAAALDAYKAELERAVNDKA